MTILYTRSLFHAVEEISTRIAMDHLRRGLKLKVSFLLLTWQVWQGGYWLIDFQKIAQVLSWQQWGSNSVPFPVSQSISRSTHLRSGAYSVGGSCFVNSFPYWQSASRHQSSVVADTGCGFLGKFQLDCVLVKCQSRAGWASDLHFPASFGKAFCPASRKFRSLSQAALQDNVSYPSNKVCFMRWICQWDAGHGGHLACKHLLTQIHMQLISHFSVHLEKRQAPPHLEALQCQHHHPRPQRVPPLHWKGNVLDAMHLSKEAGVIRKVGTWIAKRCGGQISHQTS